jgi:competence protein ComGC
LDETILEVVPRRLQHHRDRGKGHTPLETMLIVLLVLLVLLLLLLLL